MKRDLHCMLYKKLIIVALALALASALISPIHSQEDLSPAEEAVEEESEETSGLETAVQPALWKDKDSGQLYANSGVKFFLDSKDNLSKTDYIEYKINDGQFVRYSSPIVLSKEGPHSITYHAVDKAGNREFDQSFNVIIDNNPPEVELAPSRAFVEKDGRLYTAAGNTFTIRAVDQHSGVKSVSYGINTAAKEIYEDGRTVQLSDPGSQLIQYKAMDNLGNITQNGSVLVEVDSSNPRISIRPSHPLREASGVKYARRASHFSILADDEGAGVAQIMVRIDGSQEWQAYRNPLYFETEGGHSIEAKAVDAVGNESETVTSRFTVDDNPPITKLRTSVAGSEEPQEEQKDQKDQQDQQQ